MTDDGGDDLYTPAQFREYQDGYGQRDPDVDAHTALVRDERVSRYLSVVEMHYDPRKAEAPEEMPGRAEDLQHVRDITRMEATDVARQSMDGGDMQTLKHMTGDQGQRADVSGIKAIDALREQMTGPAPMFYIWAEPGAGKSNFALLLGQLWKGQQSGDALVASNIRTLKETDEWTASDGETRDGWIANYGELKEWLTQDGDPLRNDQRPKLFIFDEASSNAGGSGQDGYDTKQKMGPLAYKIRKYGGSLIVIGHDSKDVHPLIRELGTAIHKDSLKEATFYEDVRKRKGRRPIMSISGIPETDWRYDDKEPTDWSWSGGDDEDVEYEDVVEDVAMWTIVNEREKDDPVAYRKLAKKTPWDASTCSRQWDRYKEDGKYVDAVQRVENLIA